MKILLLEDDLELCKNIKISLEKENYMVDCCNDGETAMLYALNTDYAYDLAIVDRMLPIIDGLTIIKSMRKKGISIPILIITAMSTLDNRVEGLDGGADDYLVKPFHIKELLARVRALTRRPANIQLSSKLEYGDLTFDKDSRTLSTPVNSLLLTSKETELTFVFMQNPETLFSREQLTSYSVCKFCYADYYPCDFLCRCEHSSYRENQRKHLISEIDNLADLSSGKCFFGYGQSTQNLRRELSYFFFNY